MLPFIITFFLIAVGLALIFAEVILIPGTTLVGVAGLLFYGVGIYRVYAVYGSSYGTLTLGATLVAGGAIILYGFKSGAWERFALKDTLTGKAHDVTGPRLAEGARGKTLSALRPSGKALFDGSVYEVHATAEFIDPSMDVYVHKVEGRKIHVKKLNP